MRKLLAVLAGLTMAGCAAFAGDDHYQHAAECDGSNTRLACALKVDDARVKAVDDGNSEVSMEIENQGNKTVDIIAAYTGADKQTQLHHFVTNDQGQRVMKQIGRIEIYPHNEVDLSFQELHVMLIGLKDDLEQDDTVPVTLILEDGSYVKVKASVQ